MIFAFLAVRMPGQSDPQCEQDLKFLSTMKQLQPAVHKGIAQFQSGNPAASRRTLEKCAKILPQHPDACFVLAQLSYRENDFSAALDWIEKSESGFKRLQAVLDHLNQSLMKIDQNKKEELSALALDLLILSRHAQCSSERLKLESNLIQGRAKDINPEQRESVPADAFVPAEYSYVHGNILFRLKRFSEAEIRYLHAIRADPRHADAYNNLINLYLVSHRSGPAKQYAALAEKNGVALNPAIVEAARRSRP